MTPDERDRLVILENEMVHLKADVAAIKANTDQLVTAFNMGRGGFWIAAKIGGVILLALGGLAWLLDHIPNWIGKP